MHAALSKTSVATPREAGFDTPGRGTASGEFARVVETVSDLLARVKLPVAAFALRILGIARERNVSIVGDTLGPIGFVGRLPDGSMGFLYIGPMVATDAVERRIGRMLRDGMRVQLNDYWAYSNLYLEVRSLRSTSDALIDADTLFSGVLRASRRITIISPDLTDLSRDRAEVRHRLRAFRDPDIKRLRLHPS